MDKISGRPGKNFLQSDPAPLVAKTLAVARHVRRLKQIYRHHRQGWSNDKGKTLKHLASIPLHIRFDPEWRKYLDDTGNPTENKKNFEKFLQRHPQGYMFRIASAL